MGRSKSCRPVRGPNRLINSHCPYQSATVAWTNTLCSDLTTPNVHRSQRFTTTSSAQAQKPSSLLLSRWKQASRYSLVRIGQLASLRDAQIYFLGTEKGLVLWPLGRIHCLSMIKWGCSMSGLKPRKATLCIRSMSNQIVSRWGRI
jgi:hypothetical protein